MSTPTITDVCRALRRGEGKKGFCVDWVVMLDDRMVCVFDTGHVNVGQREIDRNVIDRWRVRSALRAFHKIKEKMG